jgi:hypothetical protein
VASARARAEVGYGGCGCGPSGQLNEGCSSLEIFPARCHSRESHLCGNAPAAAGPGGSRRAGRTATQPARRRGALRWKGGSCNRSHPHRGHLIQPGFPEPGRCGAPPGPCTAVLPGGAPPGRHLARALSDGGGVALIEATRFSPAFRSQHAQAGAVRRAKCSKCSAFLTPRTRSGPLRPSP